MSKTKIEIELIHDVVCSWCPIGYRNIKAALARLEDELAVEFKFLPYELNPEMPAHGERIDEHLKSRNNWNSEQLLRYREDLVETAAQAGLTYDFTKRTHYWNTARAHILLHLAEKLGKQELVNQALIQQYFTDGRNVDDVEVLSEIGRPLGIGRDALVSAFESKDVAAEMAAKHARVRTFDVRSVPTFVVNGRDVLRGSNSVEFFARYLAKYLATAAVA